MKIERDKLIIREWTREDRSALARNINNINIWNNVRDGLPFPYTEEDADFFINVVLEKAYQQDFAIEIDGMAAGSVGIIPGHDVERLNAEIGFWLGEQFWGRGVMSEAVSLISRYIFENTDMIRLFASVYEYNTASMRVLEKAGFTKIAVFHKAAIKNGKILDLHYYELVKS